MLCRSLPVNKVTVHATTWPLLLFSLLSPASLPLPPFLSFLLLLFLFPPFSPFSRFSSSSPLSLLSLISLPSLPCSSFFSPRFVLPTSWEKVWAHSQWYWTPSSVPVKKIWPRTKNSQLQRMGKAVVHRSSAVLFVVQTPLWVFWFSLCDVMIYFFLSAFFLACMLLLSFHL